MYLYTQNNPLTFVDRSGMVPSSTQSVTQPGTQSESARALLILLTISAGPAGSLIANITPEELLELANQAFSTGNAIQFVSATRVAAPTVALYYITFASGYLAGRAITTIPGVQNALGNLWLYLHLPTSY